MSDKYDLVVIGAGPGGYTAAISAAQRGMRVVLVEAKEAGGTCLNRGCIPTKTLLHAADLYYDMKHSEALGITTENLSYDMDKMYCRKDEVVGGLRNGIETLLKANGIELLHGKARILSNNTVMVKMAEGRKTLSTIRILIAAGSVPVRPPIEGIGLPGVITSDELLVGRAVDYKSLVIIGGGVIGTELAFVFQSLGCEVTVIEAMDRILPTMDREISQNLSMIMKKRGITIHTGCRVERITQKNNMLCCYFTGKRGAQDVSAQGVLASVGRNPMTDGLFDDELRIELQRGIVVDHNFKTSIKGIYAIGDVITGSTLLAHSAMAQAQNVVAAMLGEKPPVDLTAVPACIYTNPEIACVGITSEQAKAEGIKIKTGKYVMSGNGKTVIEKQERSFIKLIFDEKTEVLLGAQLMCARASDLISELTAAIIGKCTIHQMVAVIRPHPTFTEAVTEAVENALGCAIHILPAGKR